MYDWADGAGPDDECVGVCAQETANTGFTAGHRSQWMYACGHSAHTPVPDVGPATGGCVPLAASTAGQ
jgi:hypothetical protein